MFSVFNANLQTDMGKTIVRRHLANTDAQSVWKELSEHMRTSSKGASEKRRLTQFVTNTVLHDNFKGTTEQFVLHFNEQFRQLDKISEDSEKLPPTEKLTPLQTAVRSINDLRIVETLDEFQSTTYGHGSSILHFNDKFRQLDEISEDSEKLPPTVKLTLLQTAVRSINDLRIVETLDEFQSTTYGHGSSTSLSYETYYDLLINA